jgi:hypothetical protein
MFGVSGFHERRSMFSRLKKQICCILDSRATTNQVRVGGWPQSLLTSLVPSTLVLLGSSRVVACWPNVLGCLVGTIGCASAVPGMSRMQIAAASGSRRCHQGLTPRKQKSLLAATGPSPTGVAWQHSARKRRSPERILCCWRTVQWIVLSELV